MPDPLVKLLIKVLKAYDISAMRQFLLSISVNPDNRDSVSMKYLPSLHLHE